MTCSFIRITGLLCFIVSLLYAPPLLARQKFDLLPAAEYRALAREVNSRNLEETVRQLSAIPSRVSGYPDSTRAADVIRSQMRAIGLRNLKEHTHSVTVPIVEHASVSVGGETFRLYPLWPNLIRTSQVAPDGIRANLVYGGTGRLDEFNGQDMEIEVSDRPPKDRGPIVLLDFNSSSNWFNAVVLGARALIFIAPRETLRGEAEAKFLTTPINIPRFYVDRDTGERLKLLGRSGARAHLTCRMQWEQRRVVSFSGMIRGTGRVADGGRSGQLVEDPEVKRQTIILHAYYDSMSIVPELAPGAEQACGVASLLEVARVLKRHPPARNVMVLITSGHCQALSDARWFLHELTRVRYEKVLPSTRWRFVQLGLLLLAASGIRGQWRRYQKDRQVHRSGALWLGALLMLALLSDFRRLYAVMGWRITAPSQSQQAAIERITAWIDFEVTSGNRAVGTFFKGQFIDQIETILQSRFSDVGTLARDGARRSLEAQGLLPREITRARSEAMARNLRRHETEAAFRTLTQGVHRNQLGDLRRRFAVAVKKLNDNSAKDDNWDDSKWEEQTNTEMNAIREAQFDKYYADCINPIRGKSWRTYLPGGRFAFSAEIATQAARPGLAFVTVDDGRQLVDTPFDRAERVDFGNVAAQTRLLVGLTSEFLRARTDTYPRQLDNEFARISGRLVSFVPKTSYMPDVPVLDSLAVARPVQGSSKTFTGVRGEIIERVGANASFLLAGLPTAKARRINWKFEGFRTDSRTGAIEYAPDRKWILEFPNEIPINLNDKEIHVVLFECVSSGLFDMVDQRMFQLLREIYVYDAATDSEPIYFGHSLPMAQPGVSFYEPAAVVYGQKDARLKVTMGASLFGLRFVLLNTDREKYLRLRAQNRHPEPFDLETTFGRGYPMRDWESVPVTPHRVAWDMWVLDDERIRFFAEHAIRNDRVERLHRLAGEYLEEADTQLSARHYDRYMTAIRKAWSYESKAYPDVQGTASDVVRGVLFYLFLLLPFTYAAERLFVAGREIRARLMAFGGIFVVFFIGLRYAHPAFDILNVPSVVVLLAFVMLALTVAVVSIITQKFEDQMRQIKFETGGVHSTDVGRLGQSAAAFSLGISNMRRRKARTTLTCSTLILLTFTVLSFTSVKSGDRINKILLGPATFNVEAFTVVVSPVLLYSLRVLLTMGAIAALWFSSSMLRREAQRRRFADLPEAQEAAAGWKEPLRRYALYTLPTFAVLAACWSFSAMLRTTPVKKSPSGQTFRPPYNGIQIRDRSWEPLGEPMARIVEAEYRDRFPVAPRAWYYSALVGQKSFVTVQFRHRLYQASAIVGMSPDERRVTGIDRALTPGSRWFRKGELFSCVIPTDVAETIGLKQEDVGRATINLFGAPLRVIGLIRSDQLAPPSAETHAPIHDVDTEPLTPVDYVLMQERRQQGDQPVSQGQLEQYVHLAPREVLFAPYDFVIAHGGNLRSVAVNFGLGPEGARLCDRELSTLMERVELNLFAGIGEQTFLISSLASTSVQNVHNLFVPILIAALIVFNTMLGAVYERMREIGIFGSLGLAPVHIASLFLAEAFVYAVLGAISGYLIGQFGARLLYQTTVFQGLNLNYSSMSAVGTTLVVMLVVMLSTLYPARMASHMSVPGVERRWKLPPPDGDYLRLPLPFTVASGQTLGLNVFLKEFMEAHADYSLGHFSVDHVSLQALAANGADSGGANGSRAGWRLEAMVWLAPYDLGVSEHLTLDTIPTEDEHVNEVHIVIRRESGDEASWMRVTRNFLNTVRRQFLLWRTFKQEVKEEYEMKGRQVVG